MLDDGAIFMCRYIFYYLGYNNMNISMSLEYYFVNRKRFLTGKRREVENAGISGRGQITKSIVMETH